MNDKNIDLRLDEEDKSVAVLLRHPTHLDEFIIFEIYKYQKKTEGKYAKAEDLYRELDLSETQIDDALSRLQRFNLVIKERDDRLILPNWTTAERQLPEKYDISEKDIERLEKDRIREAKKRLDTWKNTLKEIRVSSEEVGKAKEEIIRMKRDMIVIFGIFVSIFSFIVVSADTVLSIGPARPLAIVITLIVTSGLIVLLLWVLKIWFK